MVAARAQVNVVPHSSVPLAPRVIIPPIPPKLALPSFEGMSLELQEATIIEDILYVAMVPLPPAIAEKRALKDNIFDTTTHTIIQMNWTD